MKMRNIMQIVEATDNERWDSRVTDDPAQMETVEVNGIARPLYNSENTLIAPTSDTQIAFWRWFGNSKVVDPHGRPLVVHRGDKLGRTEFTGREDPTSRNQGNIFFSSDRAIARGYTPHRTNSYLSSRDMNQSHGLYSAYLRIVKPVIVDAKGGDWSQIPLSGRLKKAVGSDRIQIDDLAMYVQQNANNDGLIVHNVGDQFGDGHQFVVFSGQQIKLLPSAPVQKKEVASSKEEPFRPVSYQWDDASQDYVEVPISEARSTSKLPWWTAGQVIRSEQMGFYGYDMAEFMEGEEFDYEWRLCRVPMSMLPNISLGEISHGDEADEAERNQSLRMWYDQAGIDGALSKTPPVMLLYRNKIHRILDGWHRIAIAQERGAVEVVAAVGYGRGEPDS
jgi:hypothetical protein